jgi:hypothetical protein
LERSVATQDEDLLPQGEDLAVPIVTEQAGEQGSKRRKQYQKQVPEYAKVPEYARRMTRPDGEANREVGPSNCR